MDLKLRRSFISHERLQRPNFICVKQRNTLFFARRPAKKTDTLAELLKTRAKLAFLLSVS